ncbi:hypothetical protein BCR35DRAFT_323672 [Leucosporidium creatinivorum]|uniref:Uncharacterized protein n=1 Tax=Leucosporidium creatinivorum TaxID=106004 RepID=A0A1Y2G338_9BASI|nr:hypothetical protein BCR35DRAFT_323672 [Leucosporidium creatinivorum]
MARPSSAHILAAQLEAAQAGRPSQTRSPSSGQTSPSTPWLSDSYSTTTTSPASSPDIARRPKFTSRPATARSREESDDDLEDELNDFGYGSTRKSKPKESLLDLLNSEPPAWMMDEQNVPPAPSPRKSNLLQKKIRLGSNRPSTAPADDPTARFSTLRSFKSTTSILGSRKSKSSAKGSDQFADDDDFGRSIGAGTKKLSAKDAAPSPSSTRDLADFLRTSAPPLDPLDRSSSSRTRSSTTGSIETATSGSARIMRAVVSKVGSNGSRASLVRSNSGSSQNQRSMKEAVSPGAGSQFGDASLWRSNVLSPEGHEQEEALYESVSLRASESIRTHSNASGRMSTPSSPGPIPRSASQESSLASFQLQRKPSVLSSPPSPVMSPNRAKRLSRKPPPRAEDLDDLPSTSSSSPSKPLISQTTLRLLKQANEDDTGRFTVNESPIKGRQVPAPLKTNGHLDRASTMTFGPGLLSNGSSGSELIPPASPGTSFASTSTSTSASRSPSDTDSPPSPRRTRTTSTSLDDSLINAAMAFANLGSKDHRLRHDDSTPQSKGAALRRFPSPPPDHPLPAAPNRPLSTARPVSVSFPSSRPVSIAIQHPATFGASAARLSTLSDPDTIRRPPSVDSAIDPPLSGATGSEERFDAKDTIFVALRLLRRSMRATADLPIDAESLPEEDDMGGISKGTIAALLPTLKGLQSQMREAANLIEVVVRLAEKGPASREQEDVKGEEQAEAFVVERMLGGEGQAAEKHEATADLGAESSVASGLIIAEHETEEPLGEEDDEEEDELSKKRKSTDEESLFPLLVNEIDQ